VPNFEFDPEKSAANLAKHGIDFEAAQALWQDDKRTEIPARSVAEPRLAVVGAIDAKFWTAVCTMRGDALRIISVRRARPSEVRDYERQDDQC
jgi:uncharacterized protein